MQVRHPHTVVKFGLLGLVRLTCQVAGRVSVLTPEAILSQSQINRQTLNR